MDALTVTLLILGLAVVSFSTRASFILYFRDMRLPAYVQRALRFVPAAVFTGLVVPELLFVEGSLSLEPGNAKLWAGLVGGLVAWRTHSAVGTIVAGMVTLHLVRYLLALQGGLQ